LEASEKMMERLQKIIASRGICSRRQAEALITAGKVTCNGQVALLGQSADPGRDEILVDGKPLPNPEKKLYLMLNKPRGYVTTLSDEKGRQNAAELVANCGSRVYPVGRLDMDSEGLLLFTNDGDFANLLMHPRHEVNKIYRVWVTGYTPENLEKLKEPVELDGYRIRPPKVRLVRPQGNRAIIDVTIHEGRNRQVRRMCQAADMEVARLVRIAEGSVMLGQLKTGCWRHLTSDEIRKLLE
jgi:23S rRNA pseudouridine2605 synthase